MMRCPGWRSADPAFDGGISAAAGGPWGAVQLALLGDLTGTYDGHEWLATYQIPWRMGRWTLEPTLGVSRQSKELVDYYYGVRGSEATDGRPRYTGRAATNVFVEFTLSYKLSRRWQAMGGAEYVRLGDDVESSPIVDRSYKASAFTALLYRF